MQQVRTRVLAGMTAAALVTVACGNGDSSDPDAAAAEFDCQSVEFVVSHSPGGGSDQMVRRLQPHLEEHLDVNINVVYRTGGFSSVGIQSVHDSAPDGCTVGNAVYPDMSLLTLGLPEEDEGFRVDDFTYLTWSESAPNALYVDINSEWDDLESMLDDARANPGSLSFGGTGEVAQYVFEQITDATDVELTYVPVEGGPSQIVPQILGGHLDMGVGGANHVAGPQADNVKALAVAGTERVPALPDVPTFDELGYEGVDVATVWGVIATDGLSNAVIETWNEALVYAINQVRPELEDIGYTVLAWPADDSREYALSVHAELEELLADD